MFAPVDNEVPVGFLVMGRISVGLRGLMVDCNVNGWCGGRIDENPAGGWVAYTGAIDPGDGWFVYTGGIVCPYCGLAVGIWFWIWFGGA